MNNRLLMKNFIKVFIISFICFVLSYYLGSFTYIKGETDGESNNLKFERKPNPIKEPSNTLEEGIKNSKRINFIILGMEDVRTDTIIFASFETDKRVVDLISIPRDTYIYRKGHEDAEARKINAVYGDHGINGVKSVVSYVLSGVPIHHYMTLDYNGVKRIVDSVGGVEVIVPFPMEYNDPTAVPPLKIDIDKGKQLLKGDDAIGFIRYRKGNDNKEGYADGDLGRIKAQQEFLKSLIKKTLSIKLPFIIKTSFENIKTDIKLSEAITLSKVLFKVKEEDINFNTLPGEAVFKRINGKNLSYYIFDEIKTRNTMELIYGVIKRAPEE